MDLEPEPTPRRKQGEENKPLKNTKYTSCWPKLPSKSNSKTGSDGMKKSGNNNFVHRNFKAKRSQSLLDLRGNRNPSTSPKLKYNSYSSKLLTSEYSEDLSQESSESCNESSGESDTNAKTFPLISMPMISKKPPQRKKNFAIRHKEREQLLSSIHRLNAILIDIHVNSWNSCCSRSDRDKCTQVSIPSSEDKVSLEKVATLIDSLSEQLENEVSNFIKASANDKARLEQVQNDNGILKQRLNTALNMQRNLEGELKQLSKENQLLEMENKNLAIKCVSYLPNHSASNKTDPSQASGARCQTSQTQEDVITEPHFEKKPYTDNNNNAFCERSDEGSYYKAYPSGSSENVSEYNGEDDGKREPSAYVHFDSNNNPEEDHSCNSERTPGRSNNRHAELDSITSYVRWKTLDFGRLHGRLNKNFEEMQKLKDVMATMSTEKEEILADLDVLATSCRDLSLERDNYESILKMILREKNSPESNLRYLLDGLLQHLNASCPVSNTPSHHKHLHSSKCFLESAVHVVQEQNICMREEMTKLKESLQRATGQNTFLQSANEMLTENVMDLQKQLDTRLEQVSQNEKQKQEELDKMEKLYKEVEQAKNALDKKLEEKEMEFAKLQNLMESKTKELEEQTENLKQVQEENEKLRTEVVKYKVNIEKMSQMILHLKASLREQKGKWYERVRSAASDLQSTKEHCKWLQTQIDNLNGQLVDAHQRNKMHEKDKAILAQKVLTADEERKSLDRKILEIKSIMQGDTVYREALAERNEALQMEINRLRKQKLIMMSESNNPGGEGEDTSFSEKINEYIRKFSEEISEKLENDLNLKDKGGQDCGNNTLDELSSIASAPIEKPQGVPSCHQMFSRRSRVNHQGALATIRQKHLSNPPRAAVSLHNPALYYYDKNG